MPYLTKTQLIKRWSSSLVEFFFPYPTRTEKNPRHKKGAPMCLYDFNEVKRIESMSFFREQWLKVIEKRLERIEKKRQSH